MSISKVTLKIFSFVFLLSILAQAKIEKCTDKNGENTRRRQFQINLSQFDCPESQDGFLVVRDTNNNECIELDSVYQPNDITNKVALAVNIIGTLEKKNSQTKLIKIKKLCLVSNRNEASF